MTALKRTPLYPVYAEYGAKTIDFGGWDLPVQFTGILQEHETVRTSAGMFDVSHMGEVIVSGADAENYLYNMTTNDVRKLEVGQVQYSLLCYPDGGVVDDLLIYRLSEQEYMLVINASNTEKDLDWLRKHVEGDVVLTDLSAETALLAVQGPRAVEIVAQLTDEQVSELGSFRFIREVAIKLNESMGEARALISRTGYTGEDGFEIYVAAGHAISVWQAVMSAGSESGLKPIGLGARDTLRFEARLPLYGQELSAHISPLEAGLGYFVKLDKDDFIGREALLAQKANGIPRKLVGIEMLERGIPRSHYPVYDADDGRQIGEVTTGTQSPTLKRNMGLALVDSQYAVLGTEVWVEIRGKRLMAKVVRTPFYMKGK